MLSDPELRQAFYYPGCGMDLQPLLRFSHLTDLFIYADPQYDEQQVIDRFSRISRDPPFAGRLELLGPGRHVTAEELGRRPQWPLGYGTNPRCSRKDAAWQLWRTPPAASSACADHGSATAARRTRGRIGQTLAAGETSEEEERRRSGLVEAGRGPAVLSR